MSAGDEDLNSCVQISSQSEKRLGSVCVSHLVKFKEIRRLSQAAITDIVEFVKLLHSHYVTKAQGEITALFETNDFQAPSMQQLLDCVESGCPLEGLESQYQQRAAMTQELPYVVTYKVACACSHKVYVLCIYTNCRIIKMNAFHEHMHLGYACMHVFLYLMHNADLTYLHTSILDEITDKVKELDK